MGTSRVSELILYVRKALVQRDGEGLTDGQLLDDYISHRDEAAVAALVHRHAPMVWGVCRRVLSDYHDAENAFQATFLVFVRKVASIASRELLANWLYGVAHQTARKARAAAARRNGRERQVPQLPEPAAGEHAHWHELRPLLDEELSRLPAKYRAVIVLCGLESKTRQEAARQLGVPEGTVAGRLARARAMLAKRLARRGVALSGGGLAAAVSMNGASAGVPIGVASSTIKAACLLATGQGAAVGVISVKVAALTEGVLKAMMVKNVKTTTAVLLLAAVACVGAMAVLSRGPAAAQAVASAPSEEKQRADASGRAWADKGKQKADARGKKQADKDDGGLFLMSANDKQVVAMALFKEGEYQIEADLLVYDEGKKLLTATSKGKGKVLLSIRRAQSGFGVPAKVEKPEVVRCDKLVFDRLANRITVTTGSTSKVITTQQQK